MIKKLPKSLTLKLECKNCLKHKKGYCLGTYENEKGLKCFKKYSNGQKYRSMKKGM